jgi:hypothetical protein
VLEDVLEEGRRHVEQLEAQRKLFAQVCICKGTHKHKGLLWYKVYLSGRPQTLW